MMHQSVPRCSCCNKKERTGGCVAGPDCDCDNHKRCAGCRKCTLHCTCMTVGRVMLAATKGEQIPSACADGKCHACVTCAMARLNKCREIFQQEVNGTLSYELQGDNPHRHIQQALDHSSRFPRRVREAFERYSAEMQDELALREPEPMWNDEPYTYAMHRESRRGERKQ